MSKMTLRDNHVKIPLLDGLARVRRGCGLEKEQRARTGRLVLADEARPFGDARVVTEGEPYGSDVVFERHP